MLENPKIIDFIIVVLMAVFTLPGMLLFSCYIYEKHGVLTTKFFDSKEFDLGNEFRCFMQSSKLNRICGFMTLLVWLVGGVYAIYCFFIQPYISIM